MRPWSASVKLVSVLITVLLVGAGYMMAMRFQVSSYSGTVPKHAAGSEINFSDYDFVETVYRNDEFGFEFKYLQPSELYYKYLSDAYKEDDFFLSDSEDAARFGALGHLFSNDPAYIELDRRASEYATIPSEVKLTAPWLFGAIFCTAISCGAYWDGTPDFGVQKYSGQDVLAMNLSIASEDSEILSSVPIVIDGYEGIMVTRKREVMGSEGLVEIFDRFVSVPVNDKLFTFSSANASSPENDNRFSYFDMMLGTLNFF